MQQTLLKKGGIRISAIVLIAALLVMVVTSVVGRSIATSAGLVKTQDITFTTDVGAESHAKLYIPETATASATVTPRPWTQWSLTPLSFHAGAMLSWPWICTATVIPACRRRDTPRWRWAAWWITPPTWAATPPSRSWPSMTLWI